MQEDDPVIGLMNAFRRMHERELEGRAKVMNDVRLKEARMLILLKQAHPKGVKVKDLSCAMNVTSPFVTQQLNQMEENGLVVRCRDDGDRRIVYIRLTEQGLAAAETVYTNYYNLFKTLFDKLGEEDGRQLTSLLNRFVEFMNETLSKKG